MTGSLSRLRCLVLTSIAALLTCLVLVGTLMYWATPTMIVQNRSESIVQIIAKWDDNVIELPGLSPGAQRTFKVRGESAIEFFVTYPDGTQVKSQPMYFTTATTVSAVVTANSVDVSAELKPRRAL